MSASARLADDDILTIRLPPLSPKQVLALVDLLDAVITAIWNRHDRDLAAFLAQPTGDLADDGLASPDDSLF